MRRHIKIFLLIIMILIIAIVGINIIPHFSLKASTFIGGIEDRVLEVKGEIDIKKGKKLIGETDTKKLYLNTDNLHITVEDKATKKTWTSEIEKPSNTREKSMASISYLSSDKKLMEWEAHEDVIEKENYKIEEIENGARLTLNFETATKKPAQLLPSFISKVDFKKRFTDVIEELKNKGKIKEQDAKLYENILENAYVYNPSREGYIIPKEDALPPSALKKLNEIVQIIGYTEDKLKEDNEKTGLDIEIPQVPGFRIIINVYLDGDDLIVDVPIEEATSANNFFELQTIEIYPGFGNASSENVDDGYIIVPEGGGALFELNSYNSMYPPYQKAVYNNTYFNDIYYMNKYKEDINMPVFGMTYGKGDKDTHGFMGIIESGAELSKINVQLGTKDISTGGNINNRVYPTVEVMQYSRVNLMGAYSDSQSRYVSSTPKYNMNYTVRYKLISEDATYFTMANLYKEYLVDKYNLELKYETEPKMYINMLGALTLKKHMVGIPYDKTISMTTYEQANEIVKDLEGINAIYNYEDAFYGGDRTKIPKRADLVGENGSKKELDSLMQTIQGQKNELFLGTKLLTVGSTDLTFDPELHSVYNYDGKPLQKYKYDLASGRFSSMFSPTYIIHPKYFEDIVKTFIIDTKDYKNISIDDVPNTYYASYKQDDILSPIDANKIIEKELEKLSIEKVLAFNNPNANVLPYADYAVNISRETSGYGSIYTNIPFRHLVMNGIVPYTTLDVNMSKEDLDYFLLQALELGSYPKFTISYESEDVLVNSRYKNYLSTKYDSVKERIKSLYEIYEKEFEKIKTNNIQKHTMLEAGVFETQYDGGAKVIVNYNKYPIDIDGRNIDAVGYIIIND